MKSAPLLPQALPIVQNHSQHTHAAGYPDKVKQYVIWMLTYVLLHKHELVKKGRPTQK